MIEKYLDQKNDVAFKKIFGSEKNKDILIHFLNDVLLFNIIIMIINVYKFLYKDIMLYKNIIQTNDYFFITVIIIY